MSSKVKVWIIVLVLALSILACDLTKGSGGVACYNKSCSLNSLNVRP
jgi:hypothetical protein